MARMKEKGMQILFMVAASMSILAVAMICIFIPTGIVFDNFLLMCRLISEKIPII